MPVPVDEIVCHPESLGSDQVSRWRSAMPHVPFRVDEGGPSPHGGRGRVVHLLPHRGPFLKPCPCAPHYLGCGYSNLNVVSQCPLDCAYCILKEYLEAPAVRVYTNYLDALGELDRLFAEDPAKTHRIGTGELSDSLVYDAVTGMGSDLIRYCASRPQAVLELKTKTASVGHLLDEPHGGRTVLAWSLSPPEVAAEMEALSPPPSSRLKAARLAAGRGFPVAFHFDPVIHYPGWRRAYASLVRSAFEAVPSSSVAWVSVGSLRFMPGLKDRVPKAGAGARAFAGEFVRGLDGKCRYFIDVRIELYRAVAAFVRDAGPAVPLYLCMESGEVWEEVLGWRPEDSQSVARLLTDRWDRKGTPTRERGADDLGRPHTVVARASACAGKRVGQFSPPVGARSRRVPGRRARRRVPRRLKPAPQVTDPGRSATRGRQGGPRGRSSPGNRPAVEVAAGVPVVVYVLELLESLGRRTDGP